MLEVLCFCEQKLSVKLRGGGQAIFCCIFQAQAWHSQALGFRVEAVQGSKLGLGRLP